MNEVQGTIKHYQEADPVSYRVILEVEATRYDMLITVEGSRDKQVSVLVSNFYVGCTASYGDADEMIHQLGKNMGKRDAENVALGVQYFITQSDEEGILVTEDNIYIIETPTGFRYVEGGE